MKVLVAGANGHTGRLVVRYLKEKDMSRLLSFEMKNKLMH